jgi:DNA modification methylase
VASMRDAEMEEIGVTTRERVEVLGFKERSGDAWTLYNGDCVEVLAELPENVADLSVYSPPFMSLFTYTNSERDIGNSSTRAEFLEHFGYVVRALLRATKPGRITCCHIAQVATTLATHGVIGLSDLRGAAIECFVQNGWVYHGDVCIDKDPQAQAIRTHAKGLLFVQLRKDASWIRPGLADYILVFRKPGENAVPIHPDISNDQWIEWARPVWYGISESDTLNVREARANDDDRHICPLQLGVIERCVRLWSNPGETVLSPFAGIGSEGYQAVKLGRRFVGVELKAEYFAAAAKNLTRAETETASQLSLA